MEFITLAALFSFHPSLHHSMLAPSTNLLIYCHAVPYHLTQTLSLPRVDRNPLIETLASYLPTSLPPSLPTNLPIGATRVSDNIADMHPQPKKRSILHKKERK